MDLCQTEQVLVPKNDEDGGGDGSALFIESNGLVHIINWVAFTCLASVPQSLQPLN